MEGEGGRGRGRRKKRVRIWEEKSRGWGLERGWAREGERMGKLVES